MVIKSLTLKEYLKSRDISIDECAQETGIKSPTLYGIWKGKRPSRKNEVILVKYTGGLVTW